MENQNVNQNSNDVQQEEIKKEERIEEIEEVKEEIKPSNKQEENSKPSSNQQQEDRHKQEYPYSKEERLKNIAQTMSKMNDKELEKLSNSLYMPTAPYSIVIKFLEDLNKYAEEYGKIKDEGEAEETRTSVINSVNYTLKDNIFAKNLNKQPSDMVNDLKYSDKKLNIDSIKLAKPEGGSNLSGAKAINYFRSFLSVGELIKVPLWHSGFWVMIKPPTQTEIVNLQVALYNNEIKLGRETMTLVYSNYSVVTMRIIVDFIIEHINQTSIKGSDDIDLRDYISVHDYFPLVCGMLASMNPEGVGVVKTCVNSAVLGEDGMPKCDFKVRGIVDLKKLLWVDRKALTKSMLNHMANKTWDSMSLDSVKEYQLSIASLAEKEYELTSDSGLKYKIVFGLPNLKDNITKGEEWVNGIITAAEEMFTDTDTPEQKNKKVDQLALASILSVYNTFIKKFIYPDGTVNDDSTTYDEILSTLAVDDSSFKDFVKSISDYITNSAIAMIATPNFTCPKCDKKQGNLRDSFKEFIPLDIVSYFFVLCDLRTKKTQERQI